VDRRRHPRCRGLVLQLDDLDAALLELGSQGGKFLLLDLVGRGESLQRRLIDDAELLRLYDERARIKFSKIGQGVSLLSFAGRSQRSHPDQA